MIEILGYEFMQRALIGGLLIGILTGLVGVFLVLKRLSLLGDSFAHASFGGVALGFVIGVNPLLTALLFVIVASFGLDKLVTKAKLYGESAIAVVLSFGLAFALILIGIANKYDTSIFSYLFGSILTISWIDILVVLLVLFCVLIFYYFNYKTLMYSAFNSEIAQVRNKKSELIDRLFVMLAAATIVVSIRAVGILLISALLVIPSLVGLRLGGSFKMSLVVSAITSVVGIFLGILFAYIFDLPAGGTIVMSMIGLFGISLVVRK